jgi:hypothetical protein
LPVLIFGGEFQEGKFQRYTDAGSGFDVGMGNGMDFVHRLSTFTIP